MNIIEALAITCPLENRCIDCGDPILEPNRELCPHCQRLRYADSDAEQIPSSWEEQAADDAGLPLYGPLS